MCTTGAVGTGFSGSAPQRGRGGACQEAVVRVVSPSGLVSAAGTAYWCSNGAVTGEDEQVCKAQHSTAIEASCTSSPPAHLSEADGGHHFLGEDVARGDVDARAEGAAGGACTPHIKWRCEDQSKRGRAAGPNDVTLLYRMCTRRSVCRAASSGAGLAATVCQHSVGAPASRQVRLPPALPLEGLVAEGLQVSSSPCC